MKLHSIAIEGLLILEPRIYEDGRGHFFESFNARDFKEETGIDLPFVQDNESLSRKHTLRGLHFQIPPNAQGKLVRVVKGAVLDVAVDLRTDSPTFGKHHAVLLTSKNKLQFWIPPGFAHGFLAIEDESIVAYKCTALYHAESERSLRWDDKYLGIEWGVKHPTLSKKDAHADVFSKFDSPFDMQNTAL